MVTGVLGGEWIEGQKKKMDMTSRNTMHTSVEQEMDIPRRSSLDSPWKRLCIHALCTHSRDGMFEPTMPL
jgi:hypothetical protein